MQKPQKIEPYHSPPHENSAAFAFIRLISQFFAWLRG